MCEVLCDYRYRETRRTKALTPPLLTEGTFFLSMNKTKKRAAKRSKSFTPVRTSTSPTSFRWPSPLSAEFRIRNLKAYRECYKCSLSDARDAVEAAMDRAIARANGSIPF